MTEQEFQQIVLSYFPIDAENIKVFFSKNPNWDNFVDNYLEKANPDNLHFKAKIKIKTGARNTGLELNIYADPISIVNVFLHESPIKRNAKGLRESENDLKGAIEWALADIIEIYWNAVNLLGVSIKTKMLTNVTTSVLDELREEFNTDDNANNKQQTNQ